MKKNEKTQNKGPVESKPRNHNKRYIVQFAFDYEPSKGKTMDPESKTVPDMSLTISQLLANHTRGRSSDINVREPLYFETEIPTIRDITDVQRFRDGLEEKLAQVNDFIAQERAENKKKAEESAKKQAVQLDLEIEAKKADKDKH